MKTYLMALVVLMLVASAPAGAMHSASQPSVPAL